MIDEMITKLNQLRKQLNKSLDRIENRKETVVMSVRDGQELSSIFDTLDIVIKYTDTSQ